MKSIEQIYEECGCNSKREIIEAMKIYANQKLDSAINILDFSADIIQPFEHNKELIESLKDQL